MAQSYAERLSAIRHEKGISQRRAAADLRISQALLSHYENGAREPGLQFICRACDYYGVTADFLLGRTEISDSCALDAPFSALTAVQRALRQRNSAEVEAAVAKYFGAAARRISAQIHGLADARTIARCALEQAEAEHAIAVLFASDSKSEH